MQLFLKQITCLTLYIQLIFYILYIPCVEQEADAEEERLRKERERQQKQDVMTLGETREQISNLENELSQLKEEKHQLFLQLKKVLNEDDRRRQLIKETRFGLTKGNGSQELYNLHKKILFSFKIGRAHV